MKTMKCYKLLEMDTEGRLFPLFIGKNNETKIGEWILAENIPTPGYSKRPGWHTGLIPSCPWLMSVSNDLTGYYKGRRKNWKRVFVECECNVTIDYNNEVSKLPKKCFTDKLPDNGFYIFRESGRVNTWIITDRIKIVRILPDQERQRILNDIGYDEQKEFVPYRNAILKRMKNANIA